MKRNFQFMSMLLLGAVSMGFTSCSDSDDPSTNTDTVVATSVLTSTANVYLDDVVYPTYTELANNAQTLYEKCKTLYNNAQAGKWNQSDVDAACEAFKNARREWERSEAFLYGAATDNEIDPHIDSWPLDHDALESALNDASVIAGIHGSNPGQFVYNSNGADEGAFQSVLGFHGLEFVLFRNGANRKIEALQTNDTEEGMTSVSGIDELAFAAAVSEDVRNMTFLLEYGWLGSSVSSAHKTTINAANWVIDGTAHAGLSPQNTAYGTYVLASTTSTGYYPTWQQMMNAILVAGCSNICQEVYTQKLGQAYRVATGQGGVTEEGDPETKDYIESPYSKRSFTDYQDNIYSIKNVLYGTRDITATSPVSNSLMSIMRTYNYSGYSALNTALNNALSALENAKNSGIAFVDDPANAQVKTCIDAVNELDDQLNEAGSWFMKLKVQ